MAITKEGKTTKVKNVKTPSAKEVLVKAPKKKFVLFSELPESPYLQVLLTLILLLILFGITASIAILTVKMKAARPTNYKECILLKGSVIQESYPAVCVTKKGERFIQEIPKLPKPSQIKETQIDNTSNQAPNDNLANWKTHEDIEKGFIIKYPSSWYLLSPGPGSLYGVTSISSYDPDPFSRDWKKFQLTKKDVKVLLSWLHPDNWMHDYFQSSQTFDSWLQKINSEEKTSIISHDEMTLNNISILHTVYRSERPQDNGELLDIYYIPQGDFVFSVSARPASSDHQETLIQILTILDFQNPAVQGVKIELSCLETEKEILEEISTCKEITEETCLILKEESGHCMSTCIKDLEASQCLQICKPACNETINSN